MWLSLMLIVTCCSMGTMLTAADATKPEAPPPTVSEAITHAEGLAAKAVIAGKLADAKGWAEVSFQLRAGQYIAPFGELAAQFKGHLQKAPEYIMSVMEVEAASQAGSPYHDPYQMSVGVAFFQNDPAAFKLASARSALWRKLVFYQDSIKPEQHPAIQQWIEAGCPDTNVPAGITVTPQVVALRPFLTAVKTTASN